MYKTGRHMHEGAVGRVFTSFPVSAGPLLLKTRELCKFGGVLQPVNKNKASSG